MIILNDNSKVLNHCFTIGTLIRRIEIILFIYVCLLDCFFKNYHQPINLPLEN